MRRRAGERLSEQVRELRAERRRRIGWRYIPAVLLYCAFCSLFIVYFAWATLPEAAWLFAGFAAGASLLLLWVAVNSAAIERVESAAIAESRTSDEVRRLRRRGWKVIDNLPLDGYDIDHIAIGPGGVLVLETKWTSDGLIDAAGKLNHNGHRAVDQVQRNAPRIGALLKQHGSEAQVAHSCVVSWGMRSIPEPLTSQSRGITVIDGSQLRAFLRDRQPVLSAAEVRGAYEALDRYLSIRLDDIAEKTAAANSNAWRS